MIGLVWKDMLVMRKSLRTYGMLLLFYLAMVIMEMMPLSMVIAIVEVIIMILPISAGTLSGSPWPKTRWCAAQRKAER